jgi:uncharacterized damage-inducible protein DinB
MDSRIDPTFLEFVLYNNWANQQVLRACQDLSEDQLTAVIPGAYGTIRNTLEHIIRGEVQYVSILTGSCPQPLFRWEDRPNLDDMTAYALEVGKELLEMAKCTLPTDQIIEEDEGEQYHYQALALFIQIINHGIEHRTNITTMLNQGLGKPPDVDGWAYLEAHPDRFTLK